MCLRLGCGHVGCSLESQDWYFTLSGLFPPSIWMSPKHWMAPQHNAVAHRGLTVAPNFLKTFVGSSPHRIEKSSSVGVMRPAFLWYRQDSLPVACIDIEELALLSCVKASRWALFRPALIQLTSQLRPQNSKKNYLKGLKVIGV